MKIKNIELESSNKEIFKLENFKGQNVVLFFYPKDATPGCTVEAQEFSALKTKFKKLNTVIFGVSRDTLKSHDKFIEKFDLKIDLLSDHEQTACKAFDVIKEKNMYGKKVMGIERSTFVFDTQGKLIHEWRKVKAEGHANDVLDFIKTIK